MNEGDALRPARAARLAGGRRGGDHRPRRAAGRARRLPAARLPRLDRGLGRDHPVGQVARAGTSPPRSRRTTCCSPTSWPTSYDPMFKVNPPLRTKADVEALREGLADGTIDAVATDHAPHPVEDKECEWAAAAFGMLGLETALSVVQEAMVDTGLLDWAGVADRMSTRPGPDRPARRATATRSRSGAPANLVLRRPGRTAGPVRPDRLGLAVAQHPVRRHRAARPGGRHVPPRPPHRPRREAGVSRDSAGADARCWCSRTAGSSAARPYGAVGETVGEAVFSTGMTGYQETLTDPSYHRQVVVMTAPHVGNTGVNDEDAESGRIWVAGYVVRDPLAARRAAGGRRRSLGDELAGAGRRRHQRRRHPRAHPAPARARRDAGRASRRGRPIDRRRAAGDGAGRARDGRCRPGRRGQHRPSRTSCPPTARTPFTRRRARPRDQADDAAPPGRARHRDARAAGDTTIDDVQALGADGVFFSNGPGDPAPTAHVVALLRERARRRHAVLRHLLRQPAVRPRARASGPTSSSTATAASTSRWSTCTTGKVEVTAHNHGFAVDAAARRDRPTPPYGPAPGEPRRASTTTSSRACAASTGRRSACSTTRRRRPARTTAAYLFDRFVDLMATDRGLMPRRDDIESVLVIGSGPIVIGQACEFDYSGTQACRVLRGRGPAGRPGQLQPGDDHDRSRACRRDLRRADHGRVRRAGDRQGAARRAARHARRADRAQLRGRAVRRAACSRSTASS